VKTAFKGDTSFESIHVVGFRPGSLIVIFVLAFKRAVTEEQVIAILRKAADTGNLGSFEVDSSSITAISAKGFTLRRRGPWALGIFLECLLCFDQSRAGPCGRGGRVGFSVTESSWFSICFERPSS